MVSSFNSTNTTSGDISFTNSGTLTVTGITETGGGSVTVNDMGSITISGNTSAAAAGSVNLTSSGAISESGMGLVNTTGTLTTSSVGGTTLGGANTVSIFNATNATPGDISFTNSGALTVTGITETGGGITVTNTGAITTSGAVTDATTGQSLTLNASGTLTLNAAVTGTGTDSITLDPTGMGKNITVDAAVSTGSGNISAVTTAGNITETGGVFSTTGTLSTTSGAGTTLNNANTVSTFNATNSTSGDISLTNTASTLSVTGINEVAGGTVTINNTGAVTFSNALNGGYNLLDTSSGLSTFSAAVGSTTALASVSISNAAAIDGGAVTTRGNQNYGGNVTLSANTILTHTGANSLSIAGITLSLGSSTLTDNPTTAASTGTISAPITGTGGLSVSGAGTLTLTAASTYSGATTVSAGTLADGIANALPTDTGLTVTSPGTLDLAGFNQTVGSLSGTGTVTDSGTAATLTVTGGGSFSGTITGANTALTVAGGTLTLSGTNTYTGATTISGGTLLVNGDDSAAVGPVAVNAGGLLGGTGTIGGVVTVNSKGTITAGTLGSVGTLTVGGLVFDGGTYAADFNGNTSDTIITAGLVNLQSPTPGIFAINSQVGTVSPSVVFTLIENTGTGPIQGPPLTGAAQGGTVTVNGATGTYSYAGGPNDRSFTLSTPGLTPSTSGLYAVGAGAGGGPRVEVFSADGTLLSSFFAFDSSFTGGVRVAVGDVTGSGHDDIIVSAGLGGGPEVIVFDGLTFQPIEHFYAYDPGFRGGVYVAVGDVTGAGYDDIITGLGSTLTPGPGPIVSVFDGKTTQLITSFSAYSASFQGGVRVAAADLNGTGKADIITVPGPSGGPDVRVWDVESASASLVSDFMGFDSSYRGGAFVTAGEGAIFVTPDSSASDTGSYLSDGLPVLPNTNGTPTGQLPTASALESSPTLYAFSYNPQTNQAILGESIPVLSQGYLGGARVAFGQYQQSQGVFVSSGQDDGGQLQFFAFNEGLNPTPLLNESALGDPNMVPSIYVG